MESDRVQHVLSSIKSVPVAVHNIYVHNFCPGVSNECVHPSVRNTICKTSVSLFSKCAVNVRRKLFKIASPSLPVNTVSVPHVYVVNIKTTPTYQYTNPISEPVVVHKSVLITLMLIFLLLQWLLF